VSFKAVHRTLGKLIPVSLIVGSKIRVKPTAFHRKNSYGVVSSLQSGVIVVEFLTSSNSDFGYLGVEEIEEISEDEYETHFLIQS
jgi:hypothetical protein